MEHEQSVAQEDADKTAAAPAASHQQASFLRLRLWLRRAGCAFAIQRPRSAGGARLPGAEEGQHAALQLAAQGGCLRFRHPGLRSRRRLSVRTVTPVTSLEYPGGYRSLELQHSDPAGRWPRPTQRAGISRQLHAEDMPHSSFSRSMLETNFRAQVAAVAARDCWLVCTAVDLCCCRLKAALPSPAAYVY